MQELAKEHAEQKGSASVVREQELSNFLGTFNIASDIVTQTVKTLSGC